MSTISKRSSPKVSPGEMDLNLFRDKSKLSFYGKTPQESSFYWSGKGKKQSDYENLARRIIDRLSNVYSNVYGDCFIEQCFVIHIYRGKIAGAFWQDRLTGTERPSHKAMDIERKLRGECLPGAADSKESVPDLVAIPIGISIVGSGHLNMLIINNVTRALELYDPNGSVQHRKMYGNQVSSLLKRYFLPEGYRFLSVEQTNLQTGLQGPHSEKSFSTDTCVLWCMYIAELRAKYIAEFTTHNQFKGALMKRIHKLTRYVEKLSRSRKKQMELLGEYLALYLLDFIAKSDLRDELSPNTPVEFEIIDDYFSGSPRRVVSSPIDSFLFPELVDEYFDVLGRRQRASSRVYSSPIKGTAARRPRRRTSL